MGEKIKKKWGLSGRGQAARKMLSRGCVIETVQGIEIERTRIGRDKEWAVKRWRMSCKDSVSFISDVHLCQLNKGEIFKPEQ